MFNYFRVYGNDDRVICGGSGQIKKPKQKLIKDSKSNIICDWNQFHCWTLKIEFLNHNRFIPEYTHVIGKFVKTMVPWHPCYLGRFQKLHDRVVCGSVHTGSLFAYMFVGPCKETYLSLFYQIHIPIPTSFEKIKIFLCVVETF